MVSEASRSNLTTFEFQTPCNNTLIHYILSSLPPQTFLLPTLELAGMNRHSALHVQMLLLYGEQSTVSL